MLAIGGLAATGLVVPSAQAADPKRKLPYFASIGAAKARMRTGPGRNYPSNWMYVRADLPVRVIDVFKEWRKVEDPGGTQGWMLGALLRNTRTAMVQGDVAELRETPNVAARVLWRAAPGVVGRIGPCGNGWCRLDVKGQAGFVEVGSLWGADAGEALP